MTSKRIIRDRVLWIQLLKRKRIELRISQHELARLASIPQQTISNWECFRQLPPHSKLERCECFLLKCKRGEIQYRKSPLGRLFQHEK